MLISQLCPTLCSPMDCSLPGSSVHGIFQAGILEWVVIPFSRDLPDPGIEPWFLMSPALAGEFFTTSATWKAHTCVYMHAKSLQSCLTLCSPMDCSLPGSSIHGISQARMLEWVAISFPGDLPNPGIKPASPALAGRFFTISHHGSCCCCC